MKGCSTDRCGGRHVCTRYRTFHTRRRLCTDTHKRTFTPSTGFFCVHMEADPSDGVERGNGTFCHKLCRNMDASALKDKPLWRTLASVCAGNQTEVLWVGGNVW